MIELIIGAFVALAGLAGLFFKQRNNARDKAEQSARQENMHLKAIEQKVRIEQARAETRQQNEVRQHEADERPTIQRPSGDFPR